MPIKAPYNAWPTDMSNADHHQQMGEHCLFSGRLSHDDNGSATKACEFTGRLVGS